MSRERRRRSLRQVYDMGQSSLVPFVKSESWKERHARRKEEALKHEKDVRVWCNKHKWTLYVNNNGHHWLFKTHQGKKIEWWPSSGRVAIVGKYDKTIHTHDYLQLIRILEMTL